MPTAALATRRAGFARSADPGTSRGLDRAGYCEGTAHRGFKGGRKGASASVADPVAGKPEAFAAAQVKGRPFEACKRGCGRPALFDVEVIDHVKAKVRTSAESNLRGRLPVIDGRDNQSGEAIETG